MLSGPDEPLFLDATQYTGEHLRPTLTLRPRIESPLGGCLVTRQVHLHGALSGEEPLVAADRLVKDFLGPLVWAFQHMWIERDIRVRVGTDMLYPKWVHVHLRIAIDGRDYS